MGVAGVSGGNVALGKFIADMKNITGSVYGRAPDGGPEEPPMYVFDRKILLGTDFGGLVRDTNTPWIAIINRMRRNGLHGVG